MKPDDIAKKENANLTLASKSTVVLDVFVIQQQGPVLITPVQVLSVLISKPVIMVNVSVE